MLTTAKVFCIGFPKTGTKSIGDALKHLDYNTLGWVPKINHWLTIHWHEGKIPYILKVTEAYDAFEDAPWCMLYEEMAYHYPDAKFILTYRRTPEVWLDSIILHTLYTGNWIGNYLIFGSYDPKQDSALFLEKYAEHIANVKEFFSDKPGRLLTMCFENGDGWDKLLPFLGRPADAATIAFPHSNKREDRT